MQITYLGHAGFSVETSSSIIIMDPWFSNKGAFDSAWFQYPKNHHMGHYIQNILSTSTKEKYIFISHEHQDHFDIDFLESLNSRNFTMLLANYTHQVVKQKLEKIKYNCKDIILLDNNDEYTFKDGTLILFLVDTELNSDSAILIKSGSHSFLNLNDCKINDRLENIVNRHGQIDLFTMQFSGASWYPTCYQLSADAYKIACTEKIVSKFEATALAIDVIKPKWYFPSAGPACFLDPKLIHINFLDIHTYPRAPEIIAYLNQHYKAITRSTKLSEIWPGDVLDVPRLRFIQKSINMVHDKHFKSYVMAYANEYKTMFELRRKENDKINPHDVFISLKQALIEKINELQLVNHHVTTLLYWCISECPEKMYCIDLGKKTIQVTSVIQDLNNYYRITAPKFQVNKVLNGQISWADFALNFHSTLERVPDIYNTILHGFLILESKKIKSFCEKMAETYKKQERITIEHDGKNYSILRYCPHQGADLAQGHFDGGFLVCPRHQWHFDIKNNGDCEHNGSSIDAIQIE